MNDNEATPSKLALLLLYLLLPKHIYDNVIGDLLEEFSSLSKQNQTEANAWFWQQTLASSKVYVVQYLTGKGMVKFINTMLSSAVFITCLLLVSWLSTVDSFDSYSAGLWQRLLAGQAHSVLAEAEFWQSLPSLVPSFYDGLMFIDLPAVLISTLVITALYWLNQNVNLSASQVAVIGYSAMFSPYLYSLIYLGNNTLAAKLVGPYLACGLLSIFYMLIPVSYLVNKKLTNG